MLKRLLRFITIMSGNYCPVTVIRALTPFANGRFELGYHPRSSIFCLCENFTILRSNHFPEFESPLQGEIYIFRHFRYMLCG